MVKHINSNHNLCFQSSSRPQEKGRWWRNSCPSLHISQPPSRPETTGDGPWGAGSCLSPVNTVCSQRLLPSPQPECGVGPSLPSSLFLGTEDLILSKAWQISEHNLPEQLHFSSLPCLCAIRHHHINVDTPDQAESLGNGRGRDERREPLNILSRDGLTRKLPSNIFPSLVPSPPW